MRYDRQDKVNTIPFGFSQTLKDKELILVGCGGVGSVLAELLVRGGFLGITLIDSDVVDETNLQRQIFIEEDLESFKSEALKKRLLSIDRAAKIKTYCDFLTNENISEVCSTSNLIVDATDNFEVREIINSFCEEHKKDWIYNGAVKTECVTCLFKGEDKLFHKVFPRKVQEESCCDVGVLASTTFTSASLAYNQILKYFLDQKESSLIKLDIWKNKLFEIPLKKN